MKRPATWMQTTGALLVGVQVCSSTRLRTAAHDGHSVRGLLYVLLYADAKIRYVLYRCLTLGPRLGTLAHSD